MTPVGLVLLVVAGLITLAGALANSGSDHSVSDFALLGFDVEGSSGRIFTLGFLFGAIAMLGLNMTLAGLGRGFKNRVRTRRELKHEHKERERLEKELSARDEQMAQTTTVVDDQGTPHR